jgi:AcrR family transcriptional regulator
MSTFATPRRDDDEVRESESYQALILAARKLISSRGYHSVTIGDIIQEAGVSRATFYFYFRDKRHVFVQAANVLMEELYELAGRHYPEKDEYSRIVLANIAYLQVWQREAKLIGEFFALSLVDDQVHHIYDYHRRRFEERIEGRLQRLLDQGRIPETDPRLLAAALSAMVEFFAFRFFATDDTVSAKHFTFGDAVKILSECWYRAVYGQLPPATAIYDEDNALVSSARPDRLADLG